MGRPRGGKGKKSMEAAKNDDSGSRGDEEVIPAYKRKGRRIQKLLKDDDIDEEEDVAGEVEENGDGTETVEDSKAGSVENGGKKRRRRRRRMQVKRGAGSLMEEKADEPARSPSGFRQHGSRRKSTPRRAAEAGVQSCRGSGD